MLTLIIISWSALAVLVGFPEALGYTPRWGRVLMLAAIPATLTVIWSL